MYEIRRELVKFAKVYGIRVAAREFATTKKTVRKWLSRYKEDDPGALNDQGRKPKTSPRKIKPYWRFKIIDVCNKRAENKRKINASLICREYAIPYSVPTVLKVIREAGIVEKSKLVWDEK